jgi:hypothetical protein
MRRKAACLLALTTRISIAQGLRDRCRKLRRAPCRVQFFTLAPE